MIARRSPALAARLVRFALGLCALVLAAGQLSLACHMALVGHRSCAEHGVLEHGAADEHAHATAPREGEPVSARAVSVRAAGEHEDDHEACSQVGLDQALPELRVAQDVTLIALRRAPESFDAGRLPDERQRYQLAPKSSPPRSPVQQADTSSIC